MATNIPPPKGRDGTLSLLGAAIESLNVAKGITSITRAKAVFDAASALLAMIRDSIDNLGDYVKLGLSCARVCRSLDRGLSGRRSDELSGNAYIEQYNIQGLNRRTVGAIQRKIVQQGRRNTASRFFYSKIDKSAIAAWGQDLDRILLIFDTELSMHNHVILLDIRRDVRGGQGGTNPQHQSSQASVPLGELPPPPPKAFFGRGGLVEETVGHAEKLESVALIGAGGIGKTSIALSVLDDDRIKARFGDNRRFVRCDRFPASSAHFLARLSKVIGAGLENPEDLAPLRPLLSSKEMIIVLDNAETILDPQGTNHEEIYAVVDELCQFKTVCLLITSRITTVPRYCKRPQIPTLSKEAACEIFYGIHSNGERSGTINNLLQRLDFHALSITLLATTASDNLWDHDRSAKEWDEQRAQVLRTDHNESLAKTIELSLASPTFRNLGPNARDLLGVVAFFPQGIGEKNLDWLFPTIPDRKNIFDKFCVLSLTYRSNGFITMLAPIKDYLCPRDPKSSPLLCATKDHYFTRLSVRCHPSSPGFEETRWIKSEDTNVEHLLDIFTSFDVGALNIWDVCCHFMTHLAWQKPRQTVLRSKIEGLPDGHPSKAGCLFGLSRLFQLIGKHAEQKQLLIHTLKLWRERGDDSQVALTLEFLSYVNWALRLPGEGIPQVEEALEIFKRLEDTKGQAKCLNTLARLLLVDNRLDAAEAAALRQIELLPQEFQLCRSHRLLATIFLSKGEKKKAIHHLETALTIASPPNWQDQLFWIHYEMAKLFHGERESDHANAHIEQAKSHVADNTYNLGRGAEMQARIWYQEGRLEEAKTEALRAMEVYERLGVVKQAGRCRELFQMIEC
ncbi:hypothetical protein BJ322DRAFT_1164320 [Thelephora terrestris]|uniref:NB-ARC domain-containing protein n=1 Tax=Thelephora terrestris TaxID=56493 RepID=A0A9P6H6U1_9AGAM|nr:hypothetical protein BJ322DRAFT_1164320 [Thelephora terrestris]